MSRVPLVLAVLLLALTPAAAAAKPGAGGGGGGAGGGGGSGGPKPVRDTKAPTAPGEVDALPATAQVSLAWPQSTDNVGVSGYRVYRDGVQVATTSATSYLDTGLVNGRSYAFSVRAQDLAGNLSAASPTAYAAPAPPSDVSWTCGWGTFLAGNWPTACWRPYADGSFFNQPLPDSPRLLSNSSVMIAKIMSMGPVPDLRVNPKPGGDWYHPIHWSSPSDPLYTVRCTKYGTACEMAGMSLHIPAAARPAQSTDGHMTVIDQASGWEWDFWQVQSKPADGGELVVSWGGRTRIDGPGGGDPDSDSDANGAHTGNAGGVIRFQELAAGRIEHALYVMVGCSSGTYVYPARGLASKCADPTNAPASGQWLRLNMTPEQIDALPVSGWQKTIFRAFAKYGGVVADTGGTEAFGFELESAETYRSYGIDPWEAWAAQQATLPNSNVDTKVGDDGVVRWDLEVGKGVDWANALEVVDPCVIQRTC